MIAPKDLAKIVHILNDEIIVEARDDITDAVAVTVKTARKGHSLTCCRECLLS
jgi:hypothetical protein